MYNLWEHYIDYKPMYSKEYKNLILVLLVAFFFMVMLDMSIVTIAIPKIMSSLGVNLEDVDWVMIAYNVATAIIIMPITFIVKRIGFKIPIMVIIILFTFSSMLCGFSTSINMLIFFRVLQGLSGGGIIPVGLALLAKVFDPKERGKAMGIWGIGAMAAPAIGPTLGGWITDHLTWRWVFFVNAPVAIITLIGIVIIMENDFKTQFFKENFDFIGFILFSIAIAFLLITLNEGQNKDWNSEYIHICEIITSMGFLLFFLAELFVSSPLIDFKIFKNYNFSLISMINVVRAIALFGSLFLIPVYLEDIMHYTPYMTGLIMMPQAIIVALTAPIAGRGADKYGSKLFIILGTILTAISLFLYGNLSLQSNLFDIIYPSIIRGVGFGMLYSPIMSTGLNAVKKEQIPQVSGLLPIIMRLSSGFGIAYFTNFLSIKQVYYLSKFGDRINNKSGAFLKTQSALNSSLHSMINPGILANLRINPSLAYIDNLVQMFASIQSYDDVFILAGIISLLGIIPALMLKKMY